MNIAQRERIEQNRKMLSLKSMYFNRYLLVRYVTVFFFFVNMYWLISLFMSHSPLFFIPSLLIVVLLLSIAEQVKLYSNHTNNAKYTRYCFKILLYTNMVLLLLSFFSSAFIKLYPFLIDQMGSKAFVVIMLTMGILLILSILHRLSKISRNEDKHYERIKQYEEVIF